MFIIKLFYITIQFMFLMALRILYQWVNASSTSTIQILILSWSFGILSLIIHIIGHFDTLFLVYWPCNISYQCYLYTMGSDQKKYLVSISLCVVERKWFDQSQGRDLVFTGEKWDLHREAKQNLKFIWLIHWLAMCWT